MQDGVVKNIADWSEEKISDEDLVACLEGSLPDLEQHRIGFQQVVDDLNPLQLERCGDLIAFCFQMMDGIETAVSDALAFVEDENRNGVFIAGDTVTRNSYQLNQAFAEFRNQALVALGPTAIPNLNLLLSRRDDYLEDPSENNSLLFLEAIDGERIVVYHALEDLAKEPDLPEVVTLINAFSEHRDQLNRLAEALAESGPEGNYDELYAFLGKTFAELQELVPMVQMKLRCQGETDFPDLNYLLGLMESAALGEIGDGPLIAAYEAVDESFSKSREELSQAHGNLPSALANDEIEKVLASFEEFDEGMEAVDNFLEQRDSDWLIEAKGCLLDFARRFSGHQEKLKEIEAQQGKVNCPKCATLNDPERSRCSSCGGPLPQNVAAATVSTFETKEHGALEKEQSEPLITANIEKLYEAVNNVADGGIDSQAFLDEIDRFENIIEANLKTLPEEPEQNQEEANKVYDAFEQGIETLRSALETMRTFPDSQDEEVLAKAVLMVDEGAKLVAAAGEAASR